MTVKKTLTLELADIEIEYLVKALQAGRREVGAAPFLSPPEQHHIEFLNSLIQQIAQY